MHIERDESYCPCPQAVSSVLKTLVQPSSTGGSLLDNCAGTGEIAALFSTSWNLDLYLIEPIELRYKQCLKYSKNSLCATARKAEVFGDPSVWFFNPPFEQNDPAGTLEKLIFDASLKYAAKKGTLCILILPRRSLNDLFFQRCLAEIFPVAPIIRAFPEPYATEYQQIVLFGYAHTTESMLPISIQDYLTTKNGKLPLLVRSEFKLPLITGLAQTLRLNQGNHSLGF